MLNGIVSEGLWEIMTQYLQLRLGFNTLDNVRLACWPTERTLALAETQAVIGKAHLTLPLLRLTWCQSFMVCLHRMACTCAVTMQS